MSADLLKKLGIVVGALAAIWLGSEILRGRGGEIEEIPVPDLTIDDVDSVRIVRADGSITLVRHDGGWTANGFDAAYGSIADLIAALGEGLRIQLVGQNPSMHARYEVTDDQARHLQVYRGGDVILDLLIGKRGGDFQTVFVRRPGEDDVYQTRTRLLAFADRRIDDWRDKTIAAVEPDSVRRVDIVRPDGQYVIEREDDDVWKVGGSEVDGVKVQRIVDAFRALNALGFPTEAQEDSVDLDDPDRWVRLYDAPGAEPVVELAFDSTAAGYWVRRTGNDNIFRLDRFKVDQVTPAREELERDESGS